MTKDVVFEVIAREHKCSLDALTLDTHLQDLGIDSLKAITILYQLEEQFEIEIPNEVIESIVTIGDIVSNIDRLRETNHSRCQDG